jgi:hypothetical protein
VGTSRGGEIFFSLLSSVSVENEVGAEARAEAGAEVGAAAGVEAAAVGCRSRREGEAPTAEGNTESALSSLASGLRFTMRRLVPKEAPGESEDDLAKDHLLVLSEATASRRDCAEAEGSVEAVGVA